jgi:hypothetical protein
MIFLLFSFDIADITISGEAIPIPKNTKLKIEAKGFVTRKLLAKKAPIKPGLQGRTIAPKNSPKRNALM